MMATGVYVPIWGLQMAEATVSEWLKEVGEPVTQGEGLVIIETYKVSGEVESPTDGILRRQVAQVGDVLKVGRLLAVVGSENEDEAEIDRVVRETPLVSDLPVTQPKAAPKDETATDAPQITPSLPAAAQLHRRLIRATPLARKVAKERGVDLKAVRGSGLSGRIYRRDVEAAVEAPLASRPPAKDKVVPLTSLRRAIIAKTMRTVDIPYGALSRKVKVDKLLEFRQSLAEAFARKHGLKLTLTHLFFKATAAALLEVPILNSSFDGESIVIKGSINLGMVVTSPGGGGIMIPVIQDVQAKSLVRIAREWSELTARVKAGTISFGDLSGGTFTISNAGALGIDVFTPLIHPPEAAILGISRMREEPVVEEDDIRVGRILDLIVGADHRVCDADPIGEFLVTMDRLFQNPAELLL